MTNASTYSILLLRFVLNLGNEETNFLKGELTMKKNRVLSIVLTFLMVLLCFCFIACNGVPGSGESITPSVKVKVIFNGNGATSGSMGNQTFVVGECNNLIVNTYEKEGYNFVGWSTKLDETAEYSNQAELLLNENFATSNEFEASENTITLYAVWEKKEFLVFFDRGNGDDIIIETVDYMDYITVPENPTRVGYKCVGWTLDNNRVGEYNFNTPVIENTILYAKWEELYHTITVDFAGLMENREVQIRDGEILPALNTMPSITGYNCEGLYYDAE